MKMESLHSTIGSRLSARKKMMKNGSLLLLPFLPDEIITNILSRLPVKFVIRFRLVCKGWRDLTLDHGFVALNFKHSLPLILAADFDNEDDVYELNMVDKWWEPSRSKMIYSFTIRFTLPFGYPLFSQGGLTVYNEFRQSEIILIVFNPIYPAQTVRITLSGIVCRSEIYGVFFHPLLQEYCSLWKIKASDDLWGEPRRIQYMILTLGSNPSLKNVVVNDLLLDRDKKRTSQGLLIGNYLYWMLESRPDPSKGCNDIMRFDITSEEFIIIHCPVPLNTDCRFIQTHILDIDGVLSYLLVLPCKFVIWRLKDHKEQSWTRSEYNMNIEGSIVSFECGLAVVNGKLAFLWDRTYYICNLVDGKCRKTKKIGRCIDFSHQMSLASLKNCKPTISIDQDQDKKVVVVEKNE